MPVQGKLIIDGQEVPLSAEFTIRFVEVPGGAAEPVLYRQGKRVSQAWSLLGWLGQQTDPSGGNANTC